jgi:hypothetical protein
VDGNCVRSDGCGFNDDYVWTSTVPGDQTTANAGDTTTPFPGQEWPEQTTLNPGDTTTPFPGQEWPEQTTLNAGDTTTPFPGQEWPEQTTLNAGDTTTPFPGQEWPEQTTLNPGDTTTPFPGQEWPEQTTLNAGDTTTLFPGQETTTLGPDECPAGYKMSMYNLDGTGKKWEAADHDRTIQQCAYVCDIREGCTGFEFYFVQGEAFSGFCGTYTGGDTNIQAGLSSAGWRSCVIDPATTAPTTTTTVSGQTSAMTSTTQAHSGPCPAGYEASEYNLDGATKEWALADTIAICGTTCDNRAGCTSFEFTESVAGGLCGTYTEGASNIQGNLQSAEWQSCIVKPPTGTTTPAPSPCPSGFTAVPNNLDGTGKLWATLDSERTLEQCGQICFDRTGCTSFEFFAGPGIYTGFCGTYTGGIDNIQAAYSAEGWQSCIVNESHKSASANFLSQNNKLTNEETASGSQVEMAYGVNPSENPIAYAMNPWENPEEAEAFIAAAGVDVASALNPGFNKRNGPVVASSATTTGVFASIIAVLIAAMMLL